MKVLVARRTVLWVVLLGSLLVVAASNLYFRAQEEYARRSKAVVAGLLLDRSSALSRSMVTLVGKYDFVSIEGTYPHIHWQKSMVDGSLKVGENRYWFRIIAVKNSTSIEAVMKR